MHTKPSLDLSDAKAIAAAAERYAEGNELPVSIAVVDESTYLLHLARRDGAPRTSAEGAAEKARTVAEGGHPTTFFEEPLNAGRYLMLKMPHIYPVEGGTTVIVDGHCVRAIGVAGVLPDLDAAIADAGVKAIADGEAHARGDEHAALSMGRDHTPTSSSREEPS
jgi:glc operon protein GlcG